MKRSDYNLAQSFYFAFAGVAYALLHERNLRIHFAAAALLLYITRYYDLSRGEYAVLILVMGFVITCELVNTAIEKTVDMETPAWSSLAKIAKDVAAGAVLIAGFTALAVGIALLWDTAVFRVILADIAGAPHIWIFLLVLAIIWIFLPGLNKKTGK